MRSQMSRRASICSRHINLFQTLLRHATVAIWLRDPYPNLGQTCRHLAPALPQPWGNLRGLPRHQDAPDYL